MSLVSIFTGVPQSKYAGLAVILAIGVVSVAILFGKESMPLSQKIGAILLLILVSAPGILFSLFQLTCLVTGAGVRNQRWWCSLYAWIITALLIVYAVLLVAISVLSISTGSKVISDLTNYNVEKFTDSMSSANAYAGNIFGTPSAAVSGTVSTPSSVISGNAMTSVSGQVGNGNMTSSQLNNKAYSYSSSVLPVNLTSEQFRGSVGVGNNSTEMIKGGHDEAAPYGTEKFRGSVGVANNGNEMLLGGHDEAAPYPYENGTLVPKEKFRGSVGIANNSTEMITGGHDEQSPYPFN